MESFQVDYFIFKVDCLCWCIIWIWFIVHSNTAFQLLWNCCTMIWRRNLSNQVLIVEFSFRVTLVPSSFTAWSLDRRPSSGGMLLTISLYRIVEHGLSTWVWRALLSASPSVGSHKCSTTSRLACGVDFIAPVIPKQVCLGKLVSLVFILP